MSMQTRFGRSNAEGSLVGVVCLHALDVQHVYGPLLHLALLVLLCDGVLLLSHADRLLARFGERLAIQADGHEHVPGILVVDEPHHLRYLRTGVEVLGLHQLVVRLVALLGVHIPLEHEDGDLALGAAPRGRLGARLDEAQQVAAALPLDNDAHVTAAGDVGMGHGAAVGVHRHQRPLCLDTGPRGRRPHQGADAVARPDLSRRKHERLDIVEGLHRTLHRHVDGSVVLHDHNDGAVVGVGHGADGLG
mmetsp:Transcript_20597/g.50175  ORF Transcript_20597/g.50175 Transcript_20597/m.50175 type:complete len:248 (-) Transcript_20597:186-929(-)